MPRVADQTGADLEEKDPTACVILTIAYFRGGEQATVQNSGGTYQIVKILVVGVVTETGLQAAMSQAFYTLFAIKEERGVAAYQAQIGHWWRRHVQ